ncbi:hypothetical protein niasHS_010540 [Heterodera schachtii]|uniref:Immunoglobulin domain-containing protein n=1 Tax=Heterodera schachtii TaxID=97005 RepID=A0ABD2IT39_HETSC
MNVNLGGAFGLDGLKEVRTAGEEAKEEKQKMKVDEEAVQKQKRERESRMKKRKLEEEKAKAEQEETKRKLEEMKVRALEKKEEEEQRIKESWQKRKRKSRRAKGAGNTGKEEGERRMEEEMGEKKSMKRKVTKERVTFKADEFLEEHVEPSVEQSASSLGMAEVEETDIRRRERRGEGAERETGESRMGSLNNYETKEVDYEQDEVEQFLARRRQRFQLDEVQHFDEELPRATRHRTVRKGFVSLPDSEVIAARGDTVTFECELFNESDQVSWRINGQPLERLRDNRCSVVNYAYIRQLKIVDVVPLDSNMKVQITLDDQTIESVLAVEETPVEFAEKLPRKTIAHCDETITLAATLSHDAAQKISWYHNGRELTELGTEHAISKEGCLFHGKPSLDQQKGERIVLDSNENLSLNIRLKSLPEPELDLYLNGELLTPELRTSLTVLEEALLLTRKELTKEDMGTYRVVLFNEYGEAAVEYEVYVRDVPDLPSGLMVTDVWHDYCFLKWNPPPGTDLFDDAERITGYVMKKKGAQRRVWQRVGQLSQFTNETFVEELDYDHPYVFCVEYFGCEIGI